MIHAYYVYRRVHMLRLQHRLEERDSPKLAPKFTIRCVIWLQERGTANLIFAMPSLLMFTS